MTLSFQNPCKSHSLVVNGGAWLWGELHVCYLIIDIGDSLDAKPPTPHLPPSKWFPITRGRRDSNKVLQLETSVNRWQKASGNVCRAWSTKQAGGATSVHSQHRRKLESVWGVFTQKKNHTWKIKIELRLKFEYLLNSSLAQRLNQGLRGRHHITYNCATVFPYASPWGDQWLAHEFSEQDWLKEYSNNCGWQFSESYEHYRALENVISSVSWFLTPVAFELR